MSPVTPTAVKQTLLGVKTKTFIDGDDSTPVLAPIPNTNKHEAQQAPAKPKP